MNDSCYSWVPLGFANVFICKRSHTHLPCGGGQVVLLGGRLYSNARTHSVAVEDMVEAVKQGLPNALSSGSFSQPVVFFACRFLPPVNVQLSSYDLHPNEMNQSMSSRAMSADR